jgi:hypothetical protein
MRGFLPFILLACSFAISSASLSSAQPLDPWSRATYWTRNFGGTGIDSAFRAAADAAGNKILVGYFNGSAVCGDRVSAAGG